jgi:hypothetical protein
MVSDGFAVTDPVYLAATAIWSQNPRVPYLKVGKQQLATVQVLTLTCLSTSATDTYQFQIRPAGGSFLTPHASPSSGIPSTGVPATDAATIAAAITALSIPHLTVSVSGAVITLTMAAGYLLDLVFDLAHMSFADTTADPGVATDLAAIIGADNNWYGLVLTSNSPAEVLAAASWVEANGKFFTPNCSDTAIGIAYPGTGPGDVFYQLQQHSYERTGGLFSASQLLSYSGAAWQGRLFPTVAGSESWAFKTLANVLVDNLTDGVIHIVEGKNASVYTPIFGLNLTQFGKTAGGEWLDITRGTDALTNYLQVQVLAVQANASKKIPFTDAGIDVFRSTISAALTVYVNLGFLAANPAPYVSLPTAAQVDPVNRAKRNLPLCSFSANLAGAINSVQLAGVLTT